MNEGLNIGRKFGAFSFKAFKSFNISDIINLINDF